MSVSPASISKPSDLEMMDKNIQDNSNSLSAADDSVKSCTEGTNPTVIQDESGSPSNLTSRRPDIDILNISVTWLILLYHVVVIYCPYLPYYVKDPSLPPSPGPDSPSFYALVYIVFMNTWNMPLFFFLSGVSSYFSLKRRSEGEFRKERVHRLLVPTLFIMVCTQAFYAIQYFAPMNPDCLAHYNHNATNSTPACLTWWGTVRNSSQFSTSFRWTLVSLYIYPSPQQAWFCIYLFVYSQILAFSFTNWHSKQGDAGAEHPTCCGNDNCNFLKKPFSLAARLICCMNICFLPSTNPGEFASAAKKLLMGPIKLACVPGIYLVLVELLLRWNFPDGQYHAFSFLLDWCNNFHFIGVYFLGYAIMSGDSLGFCDILKRCRWWYLIVGTLLLLAYVTVVIMGDFIFANFYPNVTKYILQCVLRGFGEWMFMVGLYAVNRNICTRNFEIIKTLRGMAMPFYLLHQQVLIVMVSGTLWVQYLGSFIVTITLSTIITCVIAFLVVMSPDSIKYFFGLPSKNKIIPGEKLSGFGPFVALCAIVIFEAIFANVIVHIL